MIKKTGLRLIIALCVISLAMFACGKGGDNPKNPEPLAGGEFNKFFPKKSGDYDVVFTQEKSGISQAKLNRSGKEVATLTITDIKGNPGAADKFKDSSSNIAGYPSASSGSQGTTVLVENRFQVQVRSKEDSFTQNDRETWLKKFDLSGLASLKNKK